MGKYTYLALMLGTIIGPLIFSFDKQVQFYKKWKFLPLGIFITLIYFVVWDAWFTKMEVWRFNSHYILGLKWLLLPLEEWLFFIFVPFACMFIYECMKYYFKSVWLSRNSASITYFIIIVLTIVTLLNTDKIYTAFNFTSAILLLSYHVWIKKTTWLGQFYLGYIVSLIPFFVVNGVLTALPVVSYNDSETLGIRIFTIPIEDTIYCMLLLLMNITLYELMQEKSRNKTAYSATTKK